MKWRALQETRIDSNLRPLREVYAERKQSIAKYVPSDVQAIHDRTVAALKAHKLATRALGVGARIPSFELLDHNGKHVSSVELLAKGRLILMFIRGRWCPFCVGQMEAMSAIATQTADAGASIVAVSPQTEKQSFFMHDQHKLRFPLLVDAGNSVARQFGLVYRVPDEEQALYARTFVNLPFANGEPSWELPIPATYVAERGGTILYASVNEDYTDRPEPMDVLAAVEHR